MSFEIQNLVVQAKVSPDGPPQPEADPHDGPEDGQPARDLLAVLPRLLRNEARKLRPGVFSSPSRPRFNR